MLPDGDVDAAVVVIIDDVVKEFSSIARKFGDPSRQGVEIAESFDCPFVETVASSRQVSLPAVVVAIMMSSTPSSMGEVMD